MNSLLWALLGYAEIEIKGASPQWMLNALTGARIPFWNIRWTDPFTVTFFLFRRDREKALALAEKQMCEGSCLRELGFFRACAGLLRRPILIGMVVLSIAAVLILPKFLWFFEVRDNITVPTDKILRTLQELHVGPGLYGPKIDPKWIKDHALERLSELEWLTVTQNGCRAQVVIRERPPVPKTLDRKQYTNVIAAKSGLITEQSILAGQAMHKVGDIVVKGEMLVSGLMNLETKYLVTHAQAEIFARTWRQARVRTPVVCLQKYRSEEEKHSIFLEIGNRRIKIFGKSGIYHASCDKMINRKILSLPGDCVLPIALVIETDTPYVLEEQPVSMQWIQTDLEDGLCHRIRKELQAGEILRTDLNFEQRSGCYWLEGIVECREMIAQEAEAKWNKEDFKHD